MPVRNALAAALKLLREQRGLSQYDFDRNAQSHISQIESAKTSLSTDSLDELCKALNIHPVAFLALVYAAQSQKPAGEVLKLAKKDLQALSLLEPLIEPETEVKSHPRITQGQEVWRSVQEKKALGHSRAETAKALELSKTTVQRYWNRSS